MHSICANQWTQPMQFKQPVAPDVRGPLGASHVLKNKVHGIIVGQSNSTCCWPKQRAPRNTIQSKRTTCSCIAVQDKCCSENLSNKHVSSCIGIRSLTTRFAKCLRAKMRLVNCTYGTPSKPTTTMFFPIRLPTIHYTHLEPCILAHNHVLTNKRLQLHQWPRDM